jgi:hypothetical protein
LYEHRAFDGVLHGVPLPSFLTRAQCVRGQDAYTDLANRMVKGTRDAELAERELSQLGFDHD